MQSENDKAFSQSIAAISTAIQIGQNGPFASEKANVDHYRRMVDSKAGLRRERIFPLAAAYHPSVELRPGLFAAVSVPFGEGPFPVVLHAHGNGFIAGDLPDYKGVNMDFAHGGFLTVLPAYRLAPEHLFPEGFDDVMFTASWIQNHIQAYGGDPTRIVVTGNSVGGGLGYAVARALMASSMRPYIRAAAGFDGLYDWRASGPTSNAAILVGGKLDRLADPRVSVAVDLKQGLLPPRLFLSTGSADFACLATLQFAQLMRRQNIDFELHLLEGNFHDAARFQDMDGGREVIRLFLDFAHRACTVSV